MDVLRWPVVGRFLGWRHSRSTLQIPVLVVSAIMVVHGLFGPSLAPKNLASSLTWIFFRGVLVLVLLCAGNFFCFACPFVLVRDATRRLHRPTRAWPRALRNKWPAIILFGAILYSYEAFSLWAKPVWTALIIVGYFAAIVVVDGIFKHASFCKFVCPIGQFNFVASTLSPLEVKVRDQGICAGCATKDCIRGARSASEPTQIVQRGCELALFQPSKVGNLDCTFCLDCVHACPHDNVGIQSRTPAEELTVDPIRSGIGYLGRRVDLSVLTVLFTFGALMNAFGMVSPVYAFERWVSAATNIHQNAVVIAVVFALVAVLAPLLLLSGAGWLSREPGRPFLPTLLRYSYGLAPLGFGIWLAHYGFHLFTGLYTIVPVVQSAVLDLMGSPWLGMPHWTWVGWPVTVVQPIQFGFLLLGFMGSVSVIYQLSQEDRGGRWLRSFLPWGTLTTILLVAAFWLMTQPMDMRATFLE